MLSELDMLGVPMAAAMRPNSWSIAALQGMGTTTDAAKLAAAMEGIECYCAERMDLPLRLATMAYLAQVGPALGYGQGHAPNVVDVGNMAGIEPQPRPGMLTDRGIRLFYRCCDEGVLIRTTSDIVALSPPLVIEEAPRQECRHARWGITSGGGVEAF